MLVPVRCFTCGNLIADKYEEYKRRVREGEEPRRVLDDMGFKRYCCRRMLLASVDLMDQVLPYYEELARRHAEFSQ
ncbi:MAG: DNA-directed RNA polymerase subunit N [Thaumarchaeota archaeon]|nr:DNA-directed RNA polymerase subunit N [Nitrososphaerota archaeon]